MTSPKASRPAVGGDRPGPRDNDRLGGAIEIIATKFSPTFQALYAGRQCIGHIIGRGRQGVEAFDADDNPAGIFATAREAADALAERAKGGAA
jgi:hypothetical protein